MVKPSQEPSHIQKNQYLFPGKLAGVGRGLGWEWGAGGNGEPPAISNDPKLLFFIAIFENLHFFASANPNLFASSSLCGKVQFALTYVFPASATLHSWRTHS